MGDFVKQGDRLCQRVEGGGVCLVGDSRGCAQYLADDTLNLGGLTLLGFFGADRIGLVATANPFITPSFYNILISLSTKYLTLNISHLKIQ